MADPRDPLSQMGRVALVTGAGMGLGRAIALALARHGADLALCDRDEAALRDTAERARALPREVESQVFDAREAEPVGAFVERIAARFGRIDVLVNNVGGTFQAAFSDTSRNAELALIDQNWSSVTHFVRASLPHLADGASIINVTSIEAHRAGPGYAVYSAMKAAVTSLTRSLALELGGRQIRVNCIAPDVIPTEGLEALGRASQQATADSARESELQSTPQSSPRTPLARTGHPDDVAGAALFLASELSRFVTGSTLHVDGGNHAAAGWHRSPDGSFRA